MLFAFLAFAAIAVFSVRQWKNNRTAALSAVIPAVACFAAFLVARKIPNCPIYDGVTEADLGFLARWISAGP